jgi:hypothetical protein
VSLLQKARAELRRRSTPPTETEMLLDHLRREEMRELRDALASKPPNYETVRRMEHRARIRLKLGLRVSDRSDPTFRPDGWALRPCSAPAHGGCDCTLRALDTRRIATRLGLEYHTRRIHSRLHPPVVVSDESLSGPDARRKPRVAAVLPFRRREPPEEPVRDDPLRLNPVREPPPLDPALQARLESGPLETVEELSRRLGVPLYPTPPEGSYR